MPFAANFPYLRISIIKVESPYVIRPFLMPTKEPTPLRIKASDEELKGRYANLMFFSHSKEEFILDFIMVCGPAGQLVSRIVISPGHMKRLLSAAQDNIANYEKTYETIEEAIEPQSAHIGFNK